MISTQSSLPVTIPRDPGSINNGNNDYQSRESLIKHLQHFHKFDHLMPLDQENIPLH